MLKNFEYEAVRDFTTDLRRRQANGITGAKGGGGTYEREVEALAGLVGEYIESVRHWIRAVFAGQASADPAVEAVFRAEGDRLLEAATQLLAGSRWLAPPHQTHGSVGDLSSAAWVLRDMLENWVTPQRAIGRGSRIVLPPDVVARAKATLDALPPLPPDWVPADPKLRAEFLQLTGRDVRPTS